MYGKRKRAHFAEPMRIPVNTTRSIFQFRLPHPKNRILYLTLLMRWWWYDDDGRGIDRQSRCATTVEAWILGVTIEHFPKVTSTIKLLWYFYILDHLKFNGKQGIAWYLQFNNLHRGSIVKLLLYAPNSYCHCGGPIYLSLPICIVFIAYMWQKSAIRIICAMIVYCSAPVLEQRDRQTIIRISKGQWNLPINPLSV